MQSKKLSYYMESSVSRQDEPNCTVKKDTTVQGQQRRVLIVRTFTGD